jgi:DNA adenine methylase
MAAPFLKWAGGKGRILNELNTRLPPMPVGGYNYFEPFLGGGALFFNLENMGKIKSATLSDINPELILCYKVIQEDVNGVITELERISKRFPKRDFYRKKFFYRMREKWNGNICKNVDDFSKSKAAKRVALTIFLNKTCFNGLFRVNSKGEFNVPYASYKNPSFVNADKLRSVSIALQGVSILCQAYDKNILSNNHNFVYFDPPYRPLTTSSSFTAYSKSGFNDSDQRKLADYVKSISTKAKIMLSNSDPKNSDEHDYFFDDLYSGLNIERIMAPRVINSDGGGRGKISEILVRNY